MRRGKPAKKYSQAGRVHDVIRLIEARHGITVDELAEETGVNRRTIHRDLGAIHEAGYPLVSEWQEGRKAYRFLTRFKDVPPINFTLQELMTLYFLRSSLDILTGTPFHDDLETIFRKVNSVLPPRYAAHLERIARVSLPLLQGGRDYGKVAEPLRLLREALLYQYRVTMTYDTKGKGEPAAYEVDPYTLIFYKGGLYLMGYAHNRRALRTFAVERIGRVEMGRERFEIPAEFRPEEQFQGAFGIVDEEAMQGDGEIFSGRSPYDPRTGSGIPASGSLKRRTAACSFHSRRGEDGDHLLASLLRQTCGSAGAPRAARRGAAHCSGDGTAVRSSAGHASL